MEWWTSDVVHHKDLIIFHTCEAFYFMAFKKINDIVKMAKFNFIKQNC